MSDSLGPHGLAACQASLSITNSQSLLTLISIESVMPSKHLIICHPLILPPLIFPSIRIFSSKSVLLIRWPNYWSFTSASVRPMNVQDGFPLGRTGWIRNTNTFERPKKCHSNLITMSLSHRHFTQLMHITEPH